MSIFAWRAWYWVLMVIGLAFAGLGAYLLARWSWRWLLFGFVVILVVVFLAILPVFVPAQRFLDPDLPDVFRDYFWPWVLVFVLGIIFSFVVIVRTIRAARPAARVESAAADLAGRFPEIDAAWQEILVRLSQASINLSAQQVFLLIAPDEEWCAALIRSAGLQLFAQAPDTAAPIHAYATGDGVLLSVSGASAFGTQDGDGVLKMEYLSGLLADQNPDCPGVRGVVFLFPISWAGQPDSVKWTAAVRDDLQTLQRRLKVRCPIFAFCTEMEATPGFTEFVTRLSSNLRQSRCGFAVPSPQTFSGDLVQRGFVWMSGWFHGWVLNLMSEDILQQASNQQLFTLDHEFRRYRKRLRSILESAFSTHREAEPVLFRGCYFMGTGTATNDQAFSAGLLRSPRGRVFTDHRVAEWTDQALADDRHYRRVALGVGIVGGLLLLSSWTFILVVSESRWWWLGLGALVLSWVVALVRVSRW